MYATRSVIYKTSYYFNKFMGNFSWQVKEGEKLKFIVIEYFDAIISLREFLNICFNNG